MRTSLGLLGAIFLAHCGSSSSATTDAGDGDGGACGANVPFGPAVLVPGIATDGDGGAVAHFHPTLDANETQIIFSAGLPAALYLAQRADRSSDFGAPIALASLNTGWDERGASLSADGLTLFYHEDSSGSGTTHLYSATRASASDTTFGAGQPLTALNGAGGAQTDPSPTHDGKTLYFASSTGGQSSIYGALASDGFASPTQVGELATSIEGSMVPTADGLGIYYAKFVGGSGFDIWLATRATASGPYTTMVPVAQINGSGNDQPSWVSADGCRIYFFSDRDGGAYQLHSASKQ